MRVSLLSSALIAILLSGWAPAEFKFGEFRERLPWIWETPARPAPPTVQDAAWPADEIDRFVLAALERNNIKPAAPASDR
ncbi:MAG: hypothetical protein QGG01_03665, partial [Roseibacillus sp.]|nr:hypothetical protein [Roseibacillus sp.]